MLGWDCYVCETETVVSSYVHKKFISDSTATDHSLKMGSTKTTLLWSPSILFVCTRYASNPGIESSGGPSRICLNEMDGEANKVICISAHSN